MALMVVGVLIVATLAIAFYFKSKRRAEDVALSKTEPLDEESKESHEDVELQDEDARL